MSEEEGISYLECEFCDYKVPYLNDVKKYPIKLVMDSQASAVIILDKHMKKFHNCSLWDFFIEYD